MALQGNKLTKSYGSRKVVNGVELGVNPGEIVGLLGPNGAGKTTTFYMLIGHVRPDSGDILLDEQNLTSLAMHLRARAGISYLAQEPSIFRGLSVEENLWAILEYRNESQAIKSSKVERLLEEFGLTSLRKNLATTLSGGEKRRCEVARALVTDPKYLLLDEPFVGIDPITVNEIQDILSNLRQKGLGLLISDHNVQATLEIVDRAYLIYGGKILAHGSAKELLNDKDVRRLYLGEKFTLNR